MADNVKVKISSFNGEDLFLESELDLVPQNIPLESEYFPLAADLLTALEELRRHDIESSVICEKESHALRESHVMNQYLDLDNEYLPKSLNLFVNERVCLFEGLDYRVEVVDYISRIWFIGPSAITGSQSLAIGQTVFVQGILA
jgi:hypothetical protein